MKTLDQKINSLKPGQSIEISRVSDSRFCTVERSGNGKQIRFVRHNGNTSIVFRVRSF